MNFHLFKNFKILNKYILNQKNSDIFYLSFDTQPEIEEKVNSLGLHKISYRDIQLNTNIFKKDYINFIGDISKSINREIWWASQTASKFRNNLPLILYKILIVSKVIKKYDVKNLIILDDCYFFHKALFFFCRENSISLSSEFESINYLFFNVKQKISFFISINYSLLNNLYKLFYSKYKLGKKIRLIDSNQPLKILKTIIYGSSFDKNSEFQDSFFGVLPKYLKSNNINYITIGTCIGSFSLIIKKIIKSKSLIFPFELFLKPRDIFSRYFELLFLKFKLKEGLYFNKINMKSFLNYYFKVNKKYEISLDHLIYHESFFNFSKKFDLESFIFPYENIPWEAMCLSGLKKNKLDIFAIGYQHSNVPSFGTNYFLSEYEIFNRPLPNKILTTGKLTKRYIIDNSYNNSLDVRTSCALRYSYLYKLKDRARKKEKTILVVLEGIIDVYNLINYVLNQLHSTKDYHVIIRTHPIMPIAKLSKFLTVDFLKYDHISISEGNRLEADLEKASILIFRQSTVAIEAIAYGIPIICFKENDIIDFDPLFELSDLKWETNNKTKLIPLLNMIFSLSDFEYLKRKKNAFKYIKKYYSECSNLNLSKFLVVK